MKMTELDQKLQKMAAENWEQFAELIGEDAIVKAKICLLRQHKNSYGQISQKLGVSYDKARDTIRYSCKDC